MEEFTAQMTAAARVRCNEDCLFECVALANHGPDEDGLWNVCSDHPVSLQSTDKAWPKLLPMFNALAAMVPSKDGHVDLLACNFAANDAGVDCIKMIESQVGTRFAASTDETGNVEHGGNWELELGGRNVAPIYFHEEKLADFTKVMAPAKKGKVKAVDIDALIAADFKPKGNTGKKPPARHKKKEDQFDWMYDKEIKEATRESQIWNAAKAGRQSMGFV